MNLKHHQTRATNSEIVILSRINFHIELRVIKCVVCIIPETIKEGYGGVLCHHQPHDATDFPGQVRQGLRMPKRPCDPGYCKGNLRPKLNKSRAW